MVIQRIITGLLIATFVGVIIWFGEPWFTIAACIVSVIATFEFYRMVKNEHIEPLTYLGLAFSILFILNAHSPYPSSDQCCTRDPLSAMPFFPSLKGILLKYNANPADCQDGS